MSAPTTLARVPCRGSCSCCGADSRPDWPIYRAGIIDTDGVPFPRLCGPCFDVIEADQDLVAPNLRAAAAVARDLLGDDLDGWQNTLEDFLG